MTTTQLLESLARCRDAYRALAGNFSALPAVLQALNGQLDHTERAIRHWEQVRGQQSQPFPQAGPLWDVLGQTKSSFETQATVVRYGGNSGDHSVRSRSSNDVLEELSAVQRRLAQVLDVIGYHDTEHPVLETGITRTCQVKIRIDKVAFSAHSYVLSKRCLHWRNEKGAVVFEHKLPTSTRKCFPYTQHRIHGKPFTATFLEVQDTVVKGTKERAVPCRPQYSFLFESDYQLFQSDIRARDILYEFHVTTIASRNSRGGADASNEVVKIWEAPTGSTDRSISFPAAHSTTTKDFELPLKWFALNPPVTPVRTNTVRLELASEPSNNDSSSLKSKFNLRRKPPTATATSAGSIRSVNTATASSAYAPPEWLARLGYLEFKFSVPSEIPAFLAAVREAYAPHVPSRVPSLYSAGSTSPSTISTAWSASPVSFQNKAHRSSERRASVTSTGTGPLSPTGMALPDAAMGGPSAKDMEMDLDDMDLALPAAEAGMGGLIIREEGDGMGMRRQVQTPSSLLRATR